VTNSTPDTMIALNLPCVDTLVFPETPECIQGNPGAFWQDCGPDALGRKALSGAEAMRRSRFCIATTARAHSTS
jgi:hypothetical protein